MRSFSPEHIFATASTANTDGLVMHTSDYKSINFTLHTITNYDGTLRFQASNAATPPDFTAARTVANPWYYIDCIALSSTNADVVGETGIAFAGTDQAGSSYEANINGAHWVNIITSGRTAGSISVTGRAYNEG